MIKDPVLFLEKTPVDATSTEILTVPDVAELLKISVVGVRRLQQQRKLPFYKVGGSIRFTRSDVMAYLRAQRVESIG